MSHTGLHIIRWVLLILSFGIFLMSLFRSRPIGLLIYLTNWGSHMTLATSIMIILAAKNQNDATFQRVTAILMQVTFLAQVLIVGVYWAVLHRYVIERYNSQPI